MPEKTYPNWCDKFDSMDATVYKSTESGNIHRVILKKNNGTMLDIRFTDKDVSVLGEFGYFIFKGNIQNPRTFFCGTYSNYSYWEEKLECAPKDHYERPINENAIIANLKKHLMDYCGIEWNPEEDPIYSDRDTGESWYDAITDAAQYNKWEIESENIGSIVDCSEEPDARYQYVCDGLQFASNFMRENNVWVRLETETSIHWDKPKE